MSKVEKSRSDAIFDDRSQVTRHGETIAIDLWYPPYPGQDNEYENAKFIEVGLCSVRAADSIRISYDFDRDGYKIEQASYYGPLEPRRQGLRHGLARGRLRQVVGTREDAGARAMSAECEECRRLAEDVERIAAEAESKGDGLARMGQKANAWRSYAMRLRNRWDQVMAAIDPEMNLLSSGARKQIHAAQESVSTMERDPTSHQAAVRRLARRRNRS